MFGFEKREALLSTQEVMEASGNAKATINAELAKPALEQAVSIEEAREHVAEEAEDLAQEQSELAAEVEAIETAPVEDNNVPTETPAA